jgi:Peroxidase
MIFTRKASIALIAALSSVQVVSGCAFASPNSNAKTMKWVARRQTDDGSGGNVLIGDLVKGATTDVGRAISSMLLSGSGAQSNATNHGGRQFCFSSKDVCCIWYQISSDLTNMFRDQIGQCNDDARAAIRLGFHDAGSWSQKLAASGQDFGGADGSFILAQEWKRPESVTLQDISQKLTVLNGKYKVGYADLIQFAAKHAVVTCPLGPRIKAYVGRKDSSKPSPTGLLPDVNDSADSLIALFNDKTITPHMLTALVGAHSTSKQFVTDTKLAGESQDSTPGIWDVLFYNQTLQPLPPKAKVFKFASDLALSKHPLIIDEWKQFIPDQQHWNEVRFPKIAKRVTHAF